MYFMKKIEDGFVVLGDFSGESDVILSKREVLEASKRVYIIGVHDDHFKLISEYFLNFLTNYGVVKSQGEMLSVMTSKRGLRLLSTIFVGDIIGEEFFLSPFNTANIKTLFKLFFAM